DDDDSGSIRVGALIDATEGTSGANADLVGLRNLDGGDVSLEAADNLDLEQDVSLVKTTGDVSLKAGGHIGQRDGSGTVLAPFRVSGSDERREDATTHQVFDDDALSVTAGGTANVVVAGGRFRRLLSATATELDAELTVTQAADVIEMAGNGTQMAVTGVDSTTNDDV